MEVRNCKTCGRLYNYIGGSYKNLCPECIRKLEEKFEVVREYISEHAMASMVDISQDCDVTTEQIERWIREDRLYFSEDSPIGIECESCGVTIKSGRFCPACKDKMANQLNGMYASPTQERKLARDNARMRFLERQD